MPTFLQQRLARIRAAGNYRQLAGTLAGTDFWSNDYLGLARLAHPESADQLPTGATGSRSISGDAAHCHETEGLIAAYHQQPAALVFHTGYTANLGLLAALLTRTDTIVYDELIHASCRDGLRLGQARAFRFRHNDLQDLRQQCERARPDGQLFVLTEGRFSMDGDLPPLTEMAAFCAARGAHLIVDEAHSAGLEGDGGAGLVAALGLQAQVFATVVTYGKAFGAHGAAVLGTENLREYLVNTCRPFIYTTAPPPAQWEAIRRAYTRLSAEHSVRWEQLRVRIEQFRQQAAAAGFGDRLLPVTGPIQIVTLPGNAAVMAAEAACRAAGLLVKGIRSPTVAAGAERLRICLHAFNTASEVAQLVAVLATVLADMPASLPGGITRRLPPE